MDKKEPSPGEPVEGCTEKPTLRAIKPGQEVKITENSTGYTSRGHIKHFLPDREVNLGKMIKALQDVYGEPALRPKKFELEIDKDYWVQVCGDPWSGNIYKYSF